MFVLPFVRHFDSVQFLGLKDSFSLTIDATQINRGWERAGNELGNLKSGFPQLLSDSFVHVGTSTRARVLTDTGRDGTLDYK
jgi:hypothetical protein